MGDVTQMLWDMEQIKQLKARYFRALDTRDWEGWGQVFTEDARMEVDGEPVVVVSGRAEIVAFVKSRLSPGVSVHHGHMPEITIESASEATGIWAMFDYVQAEPESGPPIGLVGYGHYHETYQKGADDRWRIRSMRLSRLRVDPIPPIPAIPATP